MIYTHAHFFREIADRPEDDGPRLVYADWLEEQSAGDPRAELIRVQCELAQMPADPKRVKELKSREKALIAEHGKTWAKPIWDAAFEIAGDNAPEIRFERGFPIEFSLSVTDHPWPNPWDPPEQYVEQMAVSIMNRLTDNQLLEVPLTELPWLVYTPALSGFQWLKHLPKLEIADGTLAQDTPLPELPLVKHLTVSILSAEELERVATSMKNVEELLLNCVDADQPERIMALLGSGILPKLHRLDLTIEDGRSLAALGNGPLGEKLHTLSIYFNGSFADWQALDDPEAEPTHRTEHRFFEALPSLEALRKLNLANFVALTEPTQFRQFLQLLSPKLEELQLHLAPGLWIDNRDESDPHYGYDPTQTVALTSEIRDVLTAEAGRLRGLNDFSMGSFGENVLTREHFIGPESTVREWADGDLSIGNYVTYRAPEKPRELTAAGNSTTGLPSSAVTNTPQPPSH